MIIGAFGAMIHSILRANKKENFFDEIMDYYMSHLMTVTVSGTGIKKKALLSNGILEYLDHNSPSLTKRMLYTVELTDAKKIVVFMVFKGLDDAYKSFLKRFGKYLKLESDDGVAYPTKIKVVDVNNVEKTTKSSVAIDYDLVSMSEVNLVYDFTVKYLHAKKNKYKFEDTITTYPLTRKILYTNEDVLFKDNPAYTYTSIRLTKRVDAIRVLLGGEFSLEENNKKGEFIIPLA